MDLGLADLGLDGEDGGGGHLLGVVGDFLLLGAFLISTKMTAQPRTARTMMSRSQMSQPPERLGGAGRRLGSPVMVRVEVALPLPSAWPL